MSGPKLNLPKAILIDVIPPTMAKAESLDRLQELEELVSTYGGIVVIKVIQKRGIPDYNTFVGSGRVQMLLDENRELGARYVIVNNALKPKQIYNLGEQLKPAGLEVWDRIDLILKIFAKHARTAEAKLEIELASIRHMGPRIFGMGMELSRQGGGIGTSGIGETNTEIMRRHLKERERRIKDELERYKNVREGHRKNRKRRNLLTVSIVGYTNAGKTTLLNALTGRKEYAANELFATLDTRVGELYLPARRRTVLLSDTIGFIQNLPPELLNAFASTLSEAVEADLLLHVIDVTDAKREMKIKVVEEILARLGIQDTPKIYVFNKADRARRAFGKTKLGETYAAFHPQFVSAKSGLGLDTLVSTIETTLPHFSRE